MQERFQRKSSYIVKKNIFNNQTFAILEKSFLQHDNEDYIEGMRRTIIENGGQVVQSDKKANYIIFEDGYDNNIWRNANDDQTDELNRFIVHFRWVEECIRKNAVLEHLQQLHLCPLP
jgi:hypothetical protein